MKKTNHMEWITMLKCICIIFVLMMHGYFYIPGISEFAGMFYVPCFFVMAGYTCKWEQAVHFCTFMKKKAKRLLVPYFIYNILLFLIFLGKDVMAGWAITKESFFPLLGIFYSRYTLQLPIAETSQVFLVNANSPMWFLTAMFVTYGLFSLSVMYAGQNRNKRRAVFFLNLAVGLLLHYHCPVLLPWSLDTAPVFAAMMLLGNELRYRKILDFFAARRSHRMILLASLLILFLWNGSSNVSVGDFGRMASVGIFLGIGSSLWIMILVRRASDVTFPSIFVWIGNCTLPLMCLHMFVFEVIKTALGAAAPGLLEIINYDLTNIPLWFEWGMGTILLSYGMKLLMIVITLTVIAGGAYLYDRIRASRGREEEL